MRCSSEPGPRRVKDQVMNTREIVFSGCHDGYPSYEITVQDKEVYSFEQEILVALFGSCDINVPHTVKKS
jgi:hypothetical protein